MAHKEIFHLIGNWTFLCEYNPRKSSNHAQCALLLSGILVIVWRRFVRVDNTIDKVQYTKGLFPPALGEGNQEISSCDIWGGNLLIKVQFSVQVFLWLRI